MVKTPHSVAKWTMKLNKEVNKIENLTDLLEIDLAIINELRSKIQKFRENEISSLVFLKWLKKKSANIQSKNQLSVIENIYLIVHNKKIDQAICEKYQKKKRFKTFKTGFQKFCNNQSLCLCNRENAQRSISVRDWQVVTNKRRATSMKKYGVDIPSKSVEVKKKQMKTNLKKFGCVAASQNQRIKEKIKTSNLNNLGVKWPMMRSDIKEKRTKTYLKNYGVTLPAKNPQILEKTKQTNLSKYGVENPMQNANIAEKNLKSMKKFKIYIFPSGRKELVQGFEHIVLNKLIYDEKIDENDIIVKRSKMPIIWWTDANNKKHRYYPDIFIKSQNKIIEVKSSWTNRDDPIVQDEIKRKIQATKSLGFLIELIVDPHRGAKSQKKTFEMIF